MLPNKGINDTTHKSSHTSRGQPFTPIYKQTTVHDDFASIKGKWTGDSTEVGSYASENTPNIQTQCLTFRFGSIKSLVVASSTNQMILLITMATLSHTTFLAIYTVTTITHKITVTNFVIIMLQSPSGFTPIQL